MYILIVKMKRKNPQKSLDDFFLKPKRKDGKSVVGETDVVCEVSSARCAEIRAVEVKNETASEKDSLGQSINNDVVCKENSAGCSEIRPVENETTSEKDSLAQNKPHLSGLKSDAPLQPILENFLSTNGRRFSSHWYKQHEWIEYSERENAVYCFACRHFSENILLKGEKMGCCTFIDKGFKKWRDSKALLLQHSQSERHSSSMTAWTNYKSIIQKKSVSIASHLCTARSVEVFENREHVKTLFRAASLLGRQGLSFRGHDESSESSNKSNFIELLETLTENNENLKIKMSRRYGHYTSHAYQNDIISIFGQKIKKSIISEVKKARFFSLLVDETKDCSKKEQMVIILRYFDECCIRERAVGAYHMKSLTAESLSTFIIELLTSHGVDFNFCVGQCYDGASVMSGWANGVQAKIKEVAPNSCYIHCYVHRLNLVLVDTISYLLDLKNFFSVVQHLYNFISNSNTRYQLFIECQKELGFQSILTLERNVATRWFYWYRSLSKIIARYEAILMVLDITSDSSSEASTEAIGLRIKFQSPRYIIYLIILENILGLTYNLSEELQSEKITLFKASSLVAVVRDELQNARSDEEWKQLLKKAEDFAVKYKININDGKAQSKRKKNIPSKMRDFFVTDINEENADESFKMEMKRKYFEILDRITGEFNKRFTDNAKLLQALSALDINSESFLCPEKVLTFSELYPKYLDEIALKSQLKTVKKFIMESMPKKENNCLVTILALLNKLPTAFSEVIKILQILLTLPISTASNERFFSVLKRVKTYIRTTISDERLDNLLLMSMEKDMVKSLNLDELVDDFAKLRHRRFPLMD